MPDPVISPHFTFAELTHTNSGLLNVPDDTQLANLRRLALTILEPARILLGPLHVNSGFRSKLVNAAVGSTAKHSQHLDGLAADVEPIGDLEAAFEALRHSDIPYHQLIMECHSWLHISAAPDGVKPKREALLAFGHPGSWTYQVAA